MEEYVWRSVKQNWNIIFLWTSSSRYIFHLYFSICISPITGSRSSPSTLNVLISCLISLTFSPVSSTVLFLCSDVFCFWFSVLLFEKFLPNLINYSHLLDICVGILNCFFCCVEFHWDSTKNNFWKIHLSIWKFDTWFLASYFGI